jgi:GR25 family glycosyltransferase involved in LPS biosynthesis
MSNNPFNYFDEIVCINLIERNDRFQEMNVFFESYDIPATIYRRNRHHSDGMIGCFESHMQVIHNAYHQGANNILVFEDDVRCTMSKKKLHNIVSKCIPYVNRFAYFQFGYAVMPHQLLDYIMCPRIAPNIALFAGNCAHAYCLNRLGMFRVVSTYYKSIQNTHVDLFYLDLFRDSRACCVPMLFDQNFCTQSDNVKPTTFYYDALRSISCHSSKYAFMYWSSLVKYYYIHIAILTIVIIVIYKVWRHRK